MFMRYALIPCAAAFLTTAACLAAAPAGGPTQTAPPSPIVITAAPKAQIPVFEGRDPDQIADDDALVTQIIPLQYLAAAEVRDMLYVVVNPDRPIVAAGNCVVVTDARGVIKRILQIINYIDVPPNGGNVIAVVPLPAGNAAEAARQVNAVFNSQPGP